MVTSGDVRRLFCQSVLSRGILSEKLAKTIWKKCIDVVREADDSINIPNVQSDKDWDTFISSVNQTLDDLDFEFMLCHDEVSGRKLYALVNRRDDEVAQLATDYTAAEIAYFKAIVEQIMLAPDETFSVSSFAALREASEIKPKANISKTQAETTLNSFVAKGWLLRSKRGRFSLSTRTMLELGAYIRSTYSAEVLECTICSDMVTKGVACPTANCKVRMHNHCFTLCRRKRPSCPSCNANWPAESKDLVPVGEAAARDRDDARRRSRPSRDADDSEQDDSQTQSTQSKRRQESRKSKANKVQVDGDDDSDEDEDQLEDDD